jgi:hypothetical protein
MCGVGKVFFGEERLWRGSRGASPVGRGGRPRGVSLLRVQVPFVRRWLSVFRGKASLAAGGACLVGVETIPPGFGPIVESSLCRVREGQRRRRGTSKLVLAEFWCRPVGAGNRRE